MKSMEEFYQEVTRSETLKDTLMQATMENKLEEFLRAEGVNATPQEFAAFVKQKRSNSRMQ